MIPFLNQGSEGLAELAAESDKLGVTLSADNLAKVKAYTFAQRDMQEAIAGLKLTIGLALMPKLTELAHWFTEHQPEIRQFAIETLPKIGNALEAVARDALILTEDLNDMVHPIKALKENFMTGLMGPFKKETDDAKAALDKYNLTVKHAGLGMDSLDVAFQQAVLDGVDFNHALPKTEEGLEGIGKAAKEAEIKTSELFKSIQAGSHGIITSILPTREEFGELEKSIAANSEASANWNEKIANLREELAPLQQELSEATDPKDVERLTKRISGLQTKMQELPGDIPPITSGFDTWRNRVGLLAGDYGAFEGNMKVIMDSLVEQHVRGLDDIMAVVREQGPEFAADFAQWFRDDPIAAATTVREIMPGIMGEAAREAVANVLAAVGRFNEEWQTKVIDVLKAMPEEKRIAITSTVDPKLWLFIAAIQNTPERFNIQSLAGLLRQLSPEDLAAVLPFITGAQHGFHGDVTKPTMFLAGEGGARERVDITPGGQPLSGGNGSVSASDSSAIVGKLESLIDAVLGMKIYLDTGPLVGAVSDRMGNQTNLLLRGG